MKYYERDLYQAFFNTLGQICDKFKLFTTWCPSNF